MAGRPWWLRSMVTAFESGEVVTAREIHSSTLALIRTFFLAGGVAFGKTALRLTGLEVGDLRLPQLPAEPDHVTANAAVLVEAGVLA